MSMHNRGFTAFFSVLVASLALSVGLAIYDLLVRELALSQTATQSQYAVFAADTGAECALYWDSKAPLLNDAPSIFATSSTGAVATGPFYCNTFDITTVGPPAADLSLYPGCNSTSWCRTSNANAATTTFTVNFPSPQPYCATVVVAKYANPGEPSKTTIVSHGFNTCVTTGQIRLERALQINY